MEVEEWKEESEEEKECGLKTRIRARKQLTSNARRLLLTTRCRFFFFFGRLLPLAATPSPCSAPLHRLSRSVPSATPSLGLLAASLVLCLPALALAWPGLLWRLPGLLRRCPLRRGLPAWLWLLQVPPRWRGWAASPVDVPSASADSDLGFRVVRRGLCLAILRLGHLLQRPPQFLRHVVDPQATSATI